MIILADSGILIRLHNPADADYAAIQSAIKAHHDGGDTIVYCVQNAAEFWNTCTRPSSSRGGLGLDVPETQRRLNEIEKTFSVMDDPRSLYRAWTQLLIDHRVMGKQVHDARLALMKLYGITHIMTLNGKDFARYPGIIVVDPSKSP